MHGAGGNYCEEYFCPEHLVSADVHREDLVAGDPVTSGLCRRCAKAYELRHRPRDARGRFVTVSTSAQL
jgi:hypothetical protein